MFKEGEQMKQPTLNALEREKQNILSNKYPLMSEELKQTTLKIIEEAKQRVLKNSGYMVLLNDSLIFRGGNIEVIALHLGKIIKCSNLFEYQTGDRRNYIYKQVKGGLK
jgi:hypothetical protein